MISRPTKEEVQRAACILAYSGHKFVNTADLAILREQVKVLRESLGWLVNEMDCRDDEFGGCLFTRQDFKIARDALDQTKPKDGE